MCKMTEPRQYWIDGEDADTEDNYAGNAMFEHPKQGPPQWQATVIHVIEYSAYADLQEKLKVAEEALEALSDNSNFCMGEYIGKNKDIGLKSDIAIAREALAKIRGE